MPAIKKIAIVVVLTLILFVILWMRNDYDSFGYCYYPRNVYETPCDTVSLAIDDRGEAYLFVSKSMSILEYLDYVITGYSFFQTKACVRDLVANARVMNCGDFLFVDGYAPNNPSSTSEGIDMGYASKMCVEVFDDGVRSCQTTAAAMKCKPYERE